MCHPESSVFGDAYIILCYRHFQLFDILNRFQCVPDDRDSCNSRRVITEEMMSFQGRIKNKPFPEKMSREAAEQTWSELSSSIQDIQRKNHTSTLSFEALYRHAYLLVLHKHDELLCKGYEKLVKSHLEEQTVATMMQAISVNFLETLGHVWIEFKTSELLIRDILMYYDRSPAVAKGNAMPIYHRALVVFRSEIVDRPPFNQHLRASLLNLVCLVRRNEVVDWMSLKTACEMLMELSLESRAYYEEQFENDFLRETSDFYEQLGQKLIAENSASAYICKVKESFVEEMERADRYLDKETQKKIQKVMDNELVSKHMMMVLTMDTGLVFLMDDHRVNELRSLYDLLKRVDNGLETMSTLMGENLRKRGMEVMQNAFLSGVTSLKATELIQSLLDLKCQFDTYVVEAFSNDIKFRKQVQSDFEHFLNSSSKSPEFMSLYIDEKLKKAIKSKNEGEMEIVLEKLMDLFKSLREKDIFERYYKQHLAKRLLSNRGSDDAEKAMISRLKTECGYLYTSKLEGMFRDMDVSDAFMDEYKAQSQEDVLSMRILTSVFWPMNSHVEPCIIPDSLRSSFIRFRQFYINKHQGRKIDLNFALGSADVAATFYGSEGGQSSVKEEQKILNVSTYQMILLLCFNDSPAITYERLHKMTGIPEKELKRCLQSLAMGKLTQRILTRKGNGVEISPSDEFSVNDGFSSKLKRVKVQMVSGRVETESEVVQTRGKVDEDRKHEMDAAIVRVMKARKHLSHNDLFLQVSDQLKLRFLPDPLLMKKGPQMSREMAHSKRRSFKVHCSEEHSPIPDGQFELMEAHRPWLNPTKSTVPKTRKMGA
uniref:Cullin family profile domain-containing protein n=1 Tax=Ditylenchus dipsaci TaxID=166011 RepID=A0A915DDU8_9BILA